MPKIFALCWLLVGVFIASAHGEGTAREYEVKAAMICNIAQFVEWPHDAFESESSPLIIEIVGTNPFGQALEQLASQKKVAGRAIVVKYAESIEKLEPCHLLFVAASEDANLKPILDQVRHHAVLTLGETDSFPWAGGIIRFYPVDGKVHIEVNLAAADMSHLKISSKLLKLARIFERTE
jgi:uncharacterized protein DUF4154